MLLLLQSITAYSILFTAATKLAKAAFSYVILNMSLKADFT